MADDFDPLPVLERLDDVRRHGDAADGFDVAAGHGLLIGDDRQGFHHRARIARRLFRRQPVEIGLHLRVALEAPAATRPARARPCGRPVVARARRAACARCRRRAAGSNSFASCATAARARRRRAARLRACAFDLSARSAVRSCIGRRSAFMRLGVRARTRGSPRQLHVDRRVGLGLRDADQLLARKLEQREERHDEVRHVGVLGEQRRELDEARRLQHLQHAAHLGAHRQLLARDQMMPVDARARNQRRPRRAQVVGRDVGQPRARRRARTRRAPSRNRGRRAAARRSRAPPASSARIRAAGARARRADPRLRRPAAPAACGSSSRDLISISTAAISRYSAASSSCVRRIIST